MIETVSVPNRKMRVQLNIFGSFPIIDLASEILHTGNRSVAGVDLHNWEEKVSLFLTG
jgi:hypothetical protein